jgi:hypothetical protein
MRLFNVNKIFYLNNPNSSSFGDFILFYLKKCNQSCSQDIIHNQLWKILEFFFKKRKKTRLKFILIVAQVGIFNGKDDGRSSTRKPFSTFTHFIKKLKKS